jgi:hypothetical protein
MRFTLRYATLLMIPPAVGRNEGSALPVQPHESTRAFEAGLVENVKKMNALAIAKKVHLH